MKKSYYKKSVKLSYANASGYAVTVDVAGSLVGDAVEVTNMESLRLLATVLKNGMDTTFKGVVPTYLAYRAEKPVDVPFIDLVISLGPGKGCEHRKMSAKPEAFLAAMMPSLCEVAEGAPEPKAKKSEGDAPKAKAKAEPKKDEPKKAEKKTASKAEPKKSSGKKAKAEAHMTVEPKKSNWVHANIAELDNEPAAPKAKVAKRANRFAR